MKATGVIRRIDDLGRIVIPKEIRKNLRIKEGESLEIFVEEENIVLKKYSLMNKISDLALELTESMHTFTKHNIFIADNDTILAASGPLKKKYLNKNISDSISESIKKRERMLQNYNKEIEIIDNEKINCSYVLSTIIASGEAVGIIIIISEEEKLSDIEMQLANIVSSFITKYLEE